MKRFLIVCALITVLAGGLFPVTISGAQADTPEYVIATHYPEPGGTAPAPRDQVVSFGHYNNRENDYFAVTRADAEAYTTQASEQTGLPVILLNDWADVEEGSGSLQIVNNVPIDGALYTITLPPGWTRQESLPVVLSGNGAGISNNVRLYRDFELTVPLIVGQAARAGGKLIVAISNAGGTESQGIDETTFRSVGAFFDFIAANGGDKHNAVTAGGSRGGGTALMWAINPLGLDYTVRTVFAAVPPTFYGSISERSPLTYPALASLTDLIAQDPTGWQTLNPVDLLAAVAGTTDPAEANARGPSGLAEALVGKQVFLSAGAHDHYFQLAMFLAFDRRLTELGVHHGAVITLGLGHASSDFWMKTVFLYLMGLSRGLELDVPTGRYYRIDVRPPTGEEISLQEFFGQQGINDDPDALPVTVELPLIAGPDDRIDIGLCGTPGDTVRLTAASETGEVVYTLSGTLDASECLTDSFSITLPPGDYAWTLDVNGEPVSPLSATLRDAKGCAQPAVTRILAERADPTQALPIPDRALGFGLDQYFGQPAGCPAG